MPLLPFLLAKPRLTGAIILASIALVGMAGASIMGSSVPVIAQAACSSPNSEAVSTAGMPPLVAYYHAAAAKYGLGTDGWSYLAGINNAESSFGASNEPGVHSGANYAGAMGPMQFLEATWQTYGVAVTNPHGKPNVYDPQDAVYGAANYLKASGAPGSWSTAIYSYNHATWYVEEVENHAREYAGPGGLKILETAIKEAYKGAPPSLPAPAGGVEPVAPTSGPEGCNCPSTPTTAAPAATTPGGAIDEKGKEGFTPTAGTNFSVNLEPNIAERLDMLGKTLHLSIYGISGYRTPSHSKEVGGAENDPHTRGAAADIGVNSQTKESAAQLTDEQLATVGLERPFDKGDDPKNPEVNHVQIIGVDLAAQPPINTPAEAPTSPNPAPPPIPGKTESPGSLAQPTTTSGSCETTSGSGPTVPGSKAVIEPNGNAVAPAEAPSQVKQMITAGNRINHFVYVYGGGHGDTAKSMSQTKPEPSGNGYDCSSSTSYVLWGAGYGQSVLGGSVEDSTALETEGAAGPGKWVTWYANSGHVWLRIAGISFDTAPGTSAPNPPSSGPKWMAAEDPAGAAAFTPRHIPEPWDG